MFAGSQSGQGTYEKPLEDVALLIPLFCCYSLPTSNSELYSSASSPERQEAGKEGGCGS